MIFKNILRYICNFFAFLQRNQGSEAVLKKDACVLWMTVSVWLFPSSKQGEYVDITITFRYMIIYFCNFWNKGKKFYVLLSVTIKISSTDKKNSDFFLVLTSFVTTDLQASVMW